MLEAEVSKGKPLPFHWVIFRGLSVFSIVVVGRNRLYTTTTNRLS